MGDCIFFHYNFRRRVSIWLENPDWRSLEKVEAHIITTPRSGCSVYYLRKKRLKLFGYSKVSVLVACESSLSKWWVGYPKIGFSGNPTQQQTGLNPHVLYSKGMSIICQRVIQLIVWDHSYLFWFSHRYLWSIRFIPHKAAPWQVGKSRRIKWFIWVDNLIFLGIYSLFLMCNHKLWIE